MFFKLNFVNCWLRPFKEALNQITGVEYLENECRALDAQLRTLREKYERAKATNKTMEDEKFQLAQEKEFLVVTFTELYEMLRVERDTLDFELYELKREIRQSEEAHRLDKFQYENKLETAEKMRKRFKCEIQKLDKKVEVILN